jgi:hypothetical protein
MRNLFIITLASLILLFVLFGARRTSEATEGFANLPHVRQGNYVLDLLGRLTRTSKMLASPTLWKDRIAIMGKSPVELAREYIKKERAGGHT